MQIIFEDWLFHNAFENTFVEFPPKSKHWKIIDQQRGDKLNKLQWDIIQLLKIMS